MGRPDLSLLCPRPARLLRQGGSWLWPKDQRPSFGEASMLPGPEAPELLFDAWEPSAPESLGAEPRPIPIEADPSLGSEGYRLCIDDAGPRIACGSRLGLLRAAATLRQLLVLGGAPATAVELPRVRLEDRPGFAVRGFMLDISRDKVPSMETLRQLLQSMAQLKLGVLQLYMEHTFAYQGLEEVWEHASALTATEVRELVAYGEARGVRLVPNQQSFGHLHRVLKHPRFRGLAEVPAGVEHPFSEELEPYGLAAGDPACLEFLETLYDQLLPCFQADEFNVGCDETIDLGQGRSAQRAKQLGPTGLYLEFLGSVNRLVQERGKRMQFWGDILIEHPECMERVPKDAIALEWGYEAGHPYEERLPHYAQSGMTFDVCPGTSSWGSLIGRTDNLRANLAEAALAGLRHGARGLLITDWGDYGHWQPWSVSLPGLVLGAAVAWDPSCAERIDELPLGAWLDHHALAGQAPGLGSVLDTLGRAHLAGACATINGNLPFFALHFGRQAWPHARLPGVHLEGVEACEQAIEDALDELAHIPQEAPAVQDMAQELRWASGLALAGLDLARLRLEHGLEAGWSAVPKAERTRLARRLERSARRMESVWLLRNRPGGLSDSRARLERLIAFLKSDLP